MNITINSSPRPVSRARLLTVALCATAMLAPVLGTGQRSSAAPSSTIVLVRDQDNGIVSGAEVWQEGTLRGTTDIACVLTLQNAQAGDHLQVRKLVATLLTDKGAHDGWGAHVYHTNIAQNDDGSQTDHTITDPAAMQTVVIRKNRSQIGFNIVGSYTYNPTQANHEDLRKGLKKASKYLFDVSDGQMFFEKIRLFEGGTNLDDADFQFDVISWPKADAGDIFGFRDDSTHIYMCGFGFDGSSCTQNTWHTPNG